MEKKYQADYLYEEAEAHIEVLLLKLFGKTKQIRSLTRRQVRDLFMKAFIAGVISSTSDMYFYTQEALTQDIARDDVIGKLQELIYRAWRSVRQTKDGREMLKKVEIEELVEGIGECKLKRDSG